MDYIDQLNPEEGQCSVKVATRCVRRRVVSASACPFLSLLLITITTTTTISSVLDSEGLARLEAACARPLPELVAAAAASSSSSLSESRRSLMQPSGSSKKSRSTTTTKPTTTNNISKPRAKRQAAQSASAATAAVARQRNDDGAIAYDSGDDSDVDRDFDLKKAIRNGEVAAEDSGDDDDDQGEPEDESDDVSAPILATSGRKRRANGAAVTAPVKLSVPVRVDDQPVHRVSFNHASSNDASEAASSADSITTLSSLVTRRIKIEEQQSQHDGAATVQAAKTTKKRDTAFVKDTRKRYTTSSKRIRTIIKKLEELHTMTGAQMMFFMVPGGASKSYRYGTCDGMKDYLANNVDILTQIACEGLYDQRSRLATLAQPVAAPATPATPAAPPPLAAPATPATPSTPALTPLPYFELESSAAASLSLLPPSPPPSPTPVVAPSQVDTVQTIDDMPYVDFDNPYQ